MADPLDQMIETLPAIADRYVGEMTDTERQCLHDAAAALRELRQLREGVAKVRELHRIASAMAAMALAATPPSGGDSLPLPTGDAPPRRWPRRRQYVRREPQTADDHARLAAAEAKRQRKAAQRRGPIVTPPAKPTCANCQHAHLRAWDVLYQCTNPRSAHWNRFCAPDHTCKHHTTAPSAGTDDDE